MWYLCLFKGLLTGGRLWVTEKLFAFPKKEMLYSWDRGMSKDELKRNENYFSKTSPFLINKAIESVIGEPKNIKTLRSGGILTT